MQEKNTHYAHLLRFSTLQLHHTLGQNPMLLGRAAVVFNLFPPHIRH